MKLLDTITTTIYFNHDGNMSGVGSGIRIMHEQRVCHFDKVTAVNTPKNLKK